MREENSWNPKCTQDAKTTQDIPFNLALKNNLRAKSGIASFKCFAL